MFSLTIPDLWQQEAVRALRDGRDVVVHAPTGAGKTYVFELFLPELRGPAVFTVPTRALANDKLAEWQARGWEVGIATGDLAFNLEAKVVVATLETQKGKFLQRLGPKLLVVDEYQMIGDPVRGVNYELALALAPAGTQLLLLSGSVGNPQEVVAWLRRIGREAVLVSNTERPVPLEEVDLETLPNKAPHSVRGWWPRLVGNALLAGLGPILLFAPRRRAAEELARELAAALPPPSPLALTPEQQQLAGPRLSKLLAHRVACHHSGLSYAQRAGLIEPLAKAGQLRAVVATMGLAAGINFSMRSVLVTDTRYMAGNFERQVQPDELLQMFGRAGRRGLDETGYALICSRPPRLHDGRPRQLRRSAQVDWPTLLAVMHAAAQRGEEPFAAALSLNTRLFTPTPIPLGIEHARATGPRPCGLAVDFERARFARRGIVEILNSRGLWEPLSAADVAQASRLPDRPAGVPPAETAPLGDAFILENGRWRPALSLARTLDGLGLGNLCKLTAGPQKEYGRELPLGTRRADGTLALAPWLRRILNKPRLDLAALETEVLARLPELLRLAATARESATDRHGQPRTAEKARSRAPFDAAPQCLSEGQRVASEALRMSEKSVPVRVCPWLNLNLPPEQRLVAVDSRGEQLWARFSFATQPVRVVRDSLGAALLDPPERRELPTPCRGCPELERFCAKVEITPTPADAWRRLGLIERDGTPTTRGILFSFFHHGEGLAVAAALEDTSYAIDDLIFDFANLRAGPRFAGEDSPLGGRLGALCQQTYERADLPGYLEMGVPLDYGAGASEVVREITEHDTPRGKFLTESLRPGDIERAVIEWRSLLRHILWAPDHDLPRWRALRIAAARFIESTTSPSATSFPPLTPAQRQRL